MSLQLVLRDVFVRNIMISVYCLLGKFSWNNALIDRLLALDNINFSVRRLRFTLRESQAEAASEICVDAPFLEPLLSG